MSSVKNYGFEKVEIAKYYWEEDHEFNQNRRKAVEQCLKCARKQVVSDPHFPVSGQNLQFCYAMGKQFDSHKDSRSHANFENLKHINKNFYSF